MARFIKHTELANEIYQLFEEAESLVYIVSPFIKLHPNIKRLLSQKLEKKNFGIVLLYGKNEKQLEKSLSMDDLNFFKGFENIEIHYNRDLHAKYYANEKRSIVTSINLHEYSLNNNIEVGVCFESNFLGMGKSSSLDNKTFEYFEEILEKSELVYQKVEKNKAYLFGLFKKKIGSEIEDHTRTMYGLKQSSDLERFRKENQTKKETKPKTGYCIRTRKEIPFNLKKPFCKEAYDLWAKEKNKKHPEVFCHFSGEPSDGETSFSKPVLRKYWSDLQKLNNS